MKKIGYTLITLSFLAASLVAVLQTVDVQWAYFIPILVAGFVGVALIQRAIRGHATSEHHIAANIESIHKSLESVVEKVARLNREKSTIDPYDVRHRIDDLVLEDLDNFAEARESIGHKYGLQQYADVMSLFAAGERYLNRVWSASADGYIDEVHAYLEKAETQFREAFEHLKALEAAHGT